MHYLMDLDNTLLDTFFVDREGQHRYYWTKDFEKDFNRPVSILEDLFQGPFLIALYRTNALQRFIDTFLKRHELSLTADEFLEYWLSRDMNVNNDVWHWIKQKKKEGHSFYIASNQPHVRMDYMLDHLPEWQDVFSGVFTSSRLGVAKPDPDFFMCAKNSLKVPANQLCLIDDSLENIKSAKSLGMNVIWFNSIEDLTNA